MSSPRTHHCRDIFVIALFFLSSGCSTYQSVTGYFNTYYNDKKQFDEAVSESETSPQRSNDSAYFSPYSVSPGTKAKFDKVIEKSSKIIQFYEKSSWLDDAIYMIGVSYVYKDENESAIRKFKELEENFPASGFYRKAKLWHAKAEFFMKKDDEALKVTKDLLDEARAEGDNDILLEMLMLEGQIYFERQDYQQAAEKYALAAEVPGDDKLRAIAQYEVGFTYERMRNYDEAAKAYGNVRRFKPDFNFGVKARLRYGRMLSEARHYDRALKELDDLIDQRLTIDQLSLADLEIANTDWAKGDTASAFALYAYIDSVYKGSDASAKSNYQRGVIYQKEFLNFKTALKHYTKARDQFQQSEINPLAVQKINSLTNYFKYLDNIHGYDSLYIAALHSDTSSHAALPALDSTNGKRSNLVQRDSIVQRRDSMIEKSQALVQRDSIPQRSEPTIAKSQTLAQRDSMTQRGELPVDKSRNLAQRDSIIQRRDSTNVRPNVPARDHADVLRIPPDSLAQTLAPPPDTQDEDERPAGRRGAGREQTKFRDSLSMMERAQLVSRAGLAGRSAGKDSLKGGRNQQPIVAQPLSPDSLLSLIARNKFELAGLYYLELDLPDSGLVWYAEVVHDYPTSTFVPRAIYAMSEIYRLKGDSVKVDSLYRLLLERYEKSEYAVQVRKTLKMDAILAERDTAAIEYHDAEECLLEGSHNDAINRLTNLAMHYPRSPFAAKALYTIGWMYENLLMSNDTASVWYTRLEKEYPLSVYAEKIHPKLAIKADPKAVSEFVKIKEISPVQKSEAPRTARTLNQRQEKNPQPEQVGNDRNTNRDEDVEDNTDEEDDTNSDEPDDNN